MSSSNRVRWSYAAESTWGTAPGTSYTELRRTGGTLKRPTTTVASNEVRSDRQRSNLYRTGVSANGSLEAELSYGSYDDLLEGAFAEDFSTDDTTNGSLTVVASTGTVSMTDAFTEMVVGQWFRINGSVANDGYYRIASRTSDDEAVVEDNSGLTDATGESDVDIDTDGMLRNGTTLKSFSLEQEFLDLTTQYYRFVGMVIDGFSLSIPRKGLVTLSMNLLGKTGTRETTLDRSALTDANVNEAFNSTANILDIYEAGSVLSDSITELSVELRNNTRLLEAVGSLAPVDAELGTGDFSGSVSIYYADGSLVDKYLDFTSSSLSFRATDVDGNSYIFTFPAIKFSGSLPDAGGLDQDVVIPLPFTAYRDSTTGCSIQVDRFDSLA